MKKLFVCFLIMCFLVAVTGCGDNRIIDGVEYETYGLLSKEENKCDDIQYEPVWGNIVWGCLLFTTVIAPVYFFGFSMYEPICKKGESKVFRK